MRAAPLLASHVLGCRHAAPAGGRAPFAGQQRAGGRQAAGEAVQIAYLGACTGAKLDDLRMAAQVLRGRRVAAGVSLQVAPCFGARPSCRHSAKAHWPCWPKPAPNRCPTRAVPACAGPRCGSAFPPAAGLIASTARNFAGRMGDAAGSAVWLASPLTVAASAVTGRITGPNEPCSGSRSFA
ncbi:aconitase family protein [Cupriavidus basilensis]